MQSVANLDAVSSPSRCKKARVSLLGGMTRLAQIRLLMAAVVVALLAVGCGTERDSQLRQQTQFIRRGEYLLSVTNAEPGSTFDVGVYVITKGDTVAKIAAKFQISTSDLMAINPGLDALRLLVGQRIRIYERKRL